MRRQQAKIFDAPPDGKDEAVPWSDYGFRWPAYALAHLYVSKHPHNSLFAADWCVELALKLIDKEVASWHAKRAKKQRIDTHEFPHYAAAYVLEALKDKIDAARRQRWLEHEEAWVAQALTRPLGQTGRYHDSWRMTSLYRLGIVLNQPKWRERAVELFQEMLKLQVKEGFWMEQGGPTARYNGEMLPSLAWMYRWTQDEAFGKAARQLAAFMTTYVYPDAITVGPFDGRNCNMLAYYPTCPGMELLPEGRTYAARAFQLWDQLRVEDDVTRVAPSTRDLPRRAFFLADTCRYLSMYAAQPAESITADGSLPIDGNRVLVNHSAAFDGVLWRQGAWILALSGQTSDGPRQARSPYMLDKQSRLEIWHQKGRLLVGGGHSHRDWPIPLANAFLDEAGRSDHGRPVDGEPRSALLPRYMPKAVRAEVKDTNGFLTLDYDRGRVGFRIRLVDDSKVEIETDWDVLPLQCLSLQLPVVVWRGATLSIDGKAQRAEQVSARELRRRLRVQGGPFSTTFSLRVPEEASSRVHYPLYTGQFHDRPWKDDAVRNPFDLALLSCQWTKPAKKGRTRFVLEVG